MNGLVAVTLLLFSDFATEFAKDPLPYPKEQNFCLLLFQKNLKSFFRVLLCSRDDVLHNGRT